MVTSELHQEAAREFRSLRAAYADVEDLVSIGAYKPGAKPLADRALERLDAMNAFLRQPKDEASRFDDTIRTLCEIVK